MILFVIALVVSLSSCSMQSADKTLILDGSPQELLKTIVALDQAWKYQDIQSLVYGIQISDTQNTGELILRGIMGHKEAGAFAYSPQSFKLIAEKHSDKIRSLDEKELKTMFLDGSNLGKDDKLLTMAKKTPDEDLRIFHSGLENGPAATLIFVKIDGHWKLAFSNEATVFIKTP